MPENGHVMPEPDWMIHPPKGAIVGRATESGRQGDLVSVRLSGAKRATYFRGSQTPRTFTCMAQPDLGRPLNHA